MALPNAKSKIIEHYDVVSPYYYKLWGEHLHHGYWIRGDESKEKAQQQLIEHLARLAKIPQGAAILDVGCGFGASSLYLCKQFGARSTGITISQVQVEMANAAAARERAEARFCLMDAEAMTFEKLLPVLIVGDRFHRPDHIERLFEGHGLRVHQAEPSLGTLPGCRRIGHFDLHLGNGDSGGSGAKLLAEIEAAGAESASDVQNRRAVGNLCEAREVLDQLLLRLLLGFIAADPVSVMKMLAPQFVVVGANDVVMLDDFALCVGHRHQTNVPSSGQPEQASGQPYCSRFALRSQWMRR